MPTTYILPDLAWAGLLDGIMRVARSGDVILVHTAAMHAVVAAALRATGRDDLQMELRAPSGRRQDGAA